MSVLVCKNTRLVVQGITGKEGSFHTKQIVEYGVNVVGGVTPGKGGSTHEGISVLAGQIRQQFGWGVTVPGYGDRLEIA